jgi:serine/threonine protein phosphatase PrpC/ribosomal protein L37E
MGVSMAEENPICQACGATVEATHRYCERCGHDLQTPARAPSVPNGLSETPKVVGPQWRSSTAEPGPCANCGSTGFSVEGYCEHCGQRRLVGLDRTELVLDGVAGVTDRGSHRGRNEDAFAIARLDTAAGGVIAAIVCDGVSTSNRADDAAHAAVDAGMPALLEALAALAAGSSPDALPSAEADQNRLTADALPSAEADRNRLTAERATEIAAHAAAAAVKELAERIGIPPHGNAPSCTYVSAVVTATEVTIGWVGDSRAYWLADEAGDSVMLSTDDSMAGQLAALGAPVAHGPGADPRAFALLRWLGADASDSAAHVRTFVPTGPGRVLLCTDGLSRYLPTPADLASAAVGTLPEAAHTLLRIALDAGGQDNIAIVLTPYQPAKIADSLSTPASDSSGGSTR